MTRMFVSSGTSTRTFAGKLPSPMRFAAASRTRSLCKSSPNWLATVLVAATLPTTPLLVLREVMEKFVTLT